MKTLLNFPNDYITIQCIRSFDDVKCKALVRRGLSDDEWSVFLINVSFFCFVSVRCLSVSSVVVIYFICYLAIGRETVSILLSF